MPISVLADVSLEKRLQLKGNVANKISSDVTYVVSTCVKYTLRKILSPYIVLNVR